MANLSFFYKYINHVEILSKSNSFERNREQILESALFHVSRITKHPTLMPELTQ
jgi:hypothetical protein